MKFIKYVILIFSAVLIAIPMEVSAKSKKVVNRKTQNVEFDGDMVDGKGTTPDGSYLVQKRSVDFVPLYKVRERFDSNIKASVDYLK